MSKTLADVYFKTLNFDSRVVVSKHAAERIVERNLDPECMVKVIKDILEHLCIWVFNSALRDFRPVVISFYGIKCPVQYIQESHKFVIKTVY